MTIRSNDLALTIINTGEGYKQRCALARTSPMYAQAAHAQSRARAWVRLAIDGACAYERQFGTPATASCFTPEDILLAAAEVAEYYDRHVKETDNDLGPGV